MKTNFIWYYFCESCVYCLSSTFYFHKLSWYGIQYCNIHLAIFPVIYYINLASNLVLLWYCKESVLYDSYKPYLVHVIFAWNQYKFKYYIILKVFDPSNAAAAALNMCTFKLFGLSDLHFYVRLCNIIIRWFLSL